MRTSVSHPHSTLLMCVYFLALEPYYLNILIEGTSLITYHLLQKCGWVVQLDTLDILFLYLLNTFLN